MEHIPSTIYIAVGAIVAALISGLLSFINLTISKDQKISEFRQDWINSFRKDVSELSGVLTKIKVEWSFTESNISEDTGPAFILSNLDTLEKIDSLTSKIILRLNPVEHEDYIKSIRNIEDVVSCPTQLANIKEVTILQDRLILDTQKILRDEWLIVKAGEPSYLKVKRNIKIVFKISLVLLILVTIVA